MFFIFIIAGMLTAASVVVTVLVRLRFSRKAGPVELGWLAGRPLPSRFWRRALITHAVLVPLYLFVVTPAIMVGFVASRLGTRPDERAYSGPRIALDGTWVLQSRTSLLDEAEGRARPDRALLQAASASTVRFDTEDGVSIRGFLVQPKAGPPRCTVVLVHGLFRGGLETEAPASMFRDLGAETLQIEMRNHGGSGRATPTFGLNERYDVLAAVAWLRRGPERAGRPLVLYAVSLGTAAVMRAAPDVANLSGLVLDAPMDDLLATAHRMLAQEPRPGRRALGMWPPFPTLIITALEVWNRFEFADVRPIDDLARLRPDLPALIIGGGADRRMPPASIQAIFDRLPSRPDKKMLWIRPGSDHGQVWNDDPAGYQEHLAAFLTVAVP